ncbi:MAG TPA: cellulase family glycosylhydrolase [Anaerolineae bacterium]|nr:cellulase family glycosylhydrolase [Anaerolineae bacterium]
MFFEHPWTLTIGQPRNGLRRSPPALKRMGTAFAGSLSALTLLVVTTHLTAASVASMPSSQSSAPEMQLVGRRDAASSAISAGLEHPRVNASDNVAGPDLAVTGLRVLSGSSHQASIVVTVTNRGLSDTLGADLTGWFGTDLYIKPAGAPPPAGPGDRYLGACPVIANYCPASIRWDLYKITKVFSGTGLTAGETWVLTYTYNITADGEYWLYAQADLFWGEKGDPSSTFGSSQHGRIIESDEANNIFGPVVAEIEPSRVFLPIMARNYDTTLPPFTIQMYSGINSPADFDRVKQAGARWVRMPVWWAQIEPVNTTPNQYNWGTLDSYIQAATALDIHLLLTIEDNPSWAASKPGGPVYNLADFRQFVEAVVARYPQVEYWEMYNEPDGYDRFGGKGASYAAMLKSTYPVIKAANPQAKVVLGGLALDWFQSGFFDEAFLEQVLSNCGSATCFDIANFHYYPVFRHVWESYGRDIIGKAAYLRQFLAARGYSRPVICTEASWVAGSQWGSPELQARYVAKLYARSYAAGLSIASWFSLTDADISEPGLLGPGNTPRPAYTAYQTLTSLLQRARYVRTIPASETGSSRIEGYQFSVLTDSTSKRVDVYWYDCPKMVNPGLLPEDCEDKAPLKVSATRVAKTDKLGVRVILHDADDGVVDGRVTIPGGVGSSPIYIDYNP